MSILKLVTNNSTDKSNLKPDETEKEQEKKK